MKKFNSISDKTGTLSYRKELISEKSFVRPNPYLGSETIKGHTVPPEKQKKESHLRGH